MSTPDKIKPEDFPAALAITRDSEQRGSLLNLFLLYFDDSLPMSLLRAVATSMSQERDDVEIKAVRYDRPYGVIILRCDADNQSAIAVSDWLQELFKPRYKKTLVADAQTFEYDDLPCGTGVTLKVRRSGMRPNITEEQLLAIGGVTHARIDDSPAGIVLFLRMTALEEIADCCRSAAHQGDYLLEPPIRLAPIRGDTWNIYL